MANCKDCRWASIVNGVVSCKLAIPCKFEKKINDEKDI